MTIILVIVVFIVVILWITDRKKLKTTTELLDSSLDNYVKVKNDLHGKIAVLSEKNNKLESNVIDLESKN